MTTPASPWVDAKHRASVHWVIALATVAIIFDGYDIVIYGAILPTLMADSTQLGEVTAEQAGVLGSYALIGIMIGALVAGAFGDHLGRRKVMLVSITWFSLGMAITAMTHSLGMFGALRMFTGIGMGGLIVTVGALVAEFAPAGKKNLYNAIVYGGFAVGGVIASILALLLRETIGWRGLFWIGALPLVVLLPIAITKLPESPRWLVAHGAVERAARVSLATGIPAPSFDEVAVEQDAVEKVGFAALVTRRYIAGTAVLGLTVFACLLLIFGLNTWLPKIMQSAGYNASKSLSFLIVLNGGALVGALLAAKLADRRGPQRVIAGMFAMAAVSLVVLTLPLPLPVLLAAVAFAGAGTTGTQVLIYGFVANYYMTNARAAGVAWCAGFGRLGGILGPFIGGIIIGAGLDNNVAFYIFAGVSVLGTILMLLVPRVREVGVQGAPVADQSLAPARH